MKRIPSYVIFAVDARRELRACSSVSAFFLDRGEERILVGVNRYGDVVVNYRLSLLLEELEDAFGWPYATESEELIDYAVHKYDANGEWVVDEKGTKAAIRSAKEQERMADWFYLLEQLYMEGQFDGDE